MNRLNTKRRQSSAAKKINNNNATAYKANGQGTASANNNQITADDRRNKTNQLFEELLGDDASAIANDNKEKTKGGEESVMSSVLRPQQTKKVPQSQHDNNDDPQDRNVSLSGPSKKRSQMQQHFNQQQFQQDANDEDTYMTKPREITFDTNSDDVSALFGGIGGGASVIAERMQSYRGTVAKNRRAFSAGNNRGAAAASNKQRRAPKYFHSDGDNNKHDEESRRTGVSTFQSHGVTSILEEIGLRPSSKGVDKSNASDSDEENKGHVRHRHSTDDGGGRHRSRRKDKSSFNLNSTKTAVFCVVAMFVFVQFTTIRKQNKKTMRHLNQRFDNRYAPVRDQSVSSHSGMSDGLRDLVMDNVEGGNDRRRGAYMRPNEAAKENPQRNHNWDQLDQDQMMMDDGMSDVANAGRLRGHNNGHNQVQASQRGQPETGGMQLFPGKEEAQQQKQQQQHHQQQQQQQQQHQHAVPVQQKQEVLPAQFGSDSSNTNTDDMNTSDVHPLLKPKSGLSMADAVEKLGAVDKISDIDHRPQQQLSNELIPERFKVFADLRTPFVIGRDTPFYWHIPRSGGVVMKTLLSHCLGQTLAAEVGELNGHENDEEVKVVSFAEHNYTSVNVATPEGISRALNLGLVPSHLSDTIVSSHVDLIPSLFNANDKGKAFVMMRHPCDRATSMFYFLQGTGYPPLQNMTLDDYAKSELIENNWMVRILSESMTGPIDMDNLDIAKEVLKRKFLVGLLDNKRGSFARFDHYFKWKESPKYASEFGCRKQLMDERYVPKHPVRKGSETWNLLMEQNRFDIHLYDYAKELFVQQSFIFGL
eukprot:scaffold4410_cov127-Skeletonema_marinoi.AAC.3